MRFLNRLGRTLTVGMCLIIATVTVLSAAYSATLSLAENGTSAYTQIGVKVPANVSNWVSQNFIDADGLDVQLLKGSTQMPLMLTDDALYFADGITEGGTNNYTLTTGNTPGTSMPIVTGYGGYVTVADNASLELANNFELEFSGYINTSTESSFITKGSDFDVSISGATDITATVISTSGTESESQTGNDTEISTYGANYTSQTFMFTNSVLVDEIQIYCFETTNPAGEFIVNIHATSGGKPTGDSLATGSITAAGIDASSLKTISLLGSPVKLTGGVIYAAVFSAPTAASAVEIRVDTTSPSYSNGTALTSGDSGSTWTIQSGSDLRFTIDGDIIVEALVTASGIASGEHTVKITADTTNLKIYIDTVEEDTVALAGATVADNADDFVLFANNVMPYVNYYKHTVSGTLQAEYQPETIIIGTALPDLENSYNGVITWGANPAGLSAALGSFRSAAGTTGTTTGTPQPGIIGGVGGIDNTSSTTTGTFLDPMIAIFVTASNGSLTTELAWWGLYGIALLIAYILTYARFQYTLLAGVASVIVSVIFCVALNTIPDVMLALNIALVIGITLLESRNTV